jgi:hypothetical protein
VEVRASGKVGSYKKSGHCYRQRSVTEVWCRKNADSNSYYNNNKNEGGGQRKDKDRRTE